MEWIERLNCAVDYIEKHLTDEMDYDRIAQIACCSTYHFQRVFSYVAELPLSEYIRRRRMTRAAVDLQNGDARVVDVALKYGYDSPTAFNRAFQSVHGVAPSQAKASGVILKAYPPVSFRMIIKGDVELNYRVEKRDAFRIVGIAQPLFKEVEKNFQVVPQMWQKAAMDKTVEKIASMANGEPMGVLGVSVCNEQEQWRYFIAAASDRPLCDPLEEYWVPASTWAVFPGRGEMPGCIQELEKRIVTEWLPSSGYEYANAPDIEVYLTADPKNAEFEVWIPVVKAQRS